MVKNWNTNGVQGPNMQQGQQIKKTSKYTCIIHPNMAKLTKGIWNTPSLLIVKWTISVCHKDEFHVKQEKPDLKKYILYDFIY